MKDAADQSALSYLRNPTYRWSVFACSHVCMLCKTISSVVNLNKHLIAHQSFVSYIDKHAVYVTIGSRLQWFSCVMYANVLKRKVA